METQEGFYNVASGKAGDAGGNSIASPRVCGIVFTPLDKQLPHQIKMARKCSEADCLGFRNGRNSASKGAILSGSARPVREPRPEGAQLLPRSGRRN